MSNIKFLFHLVKCEKNKIKYNNVTICYTMVGFCNNDFKNICIFRLGNVTQAHARAQREVQVNIFTSLERYKGGFEQISI